MWVEFIITDRVLGARLAQRRLTVRLLLALAHWLQPERD